MFKKLFRGLRRKPVEDTSEIDVIARGISGSGRSGLYHSGSSQDPGALYDDSPQMSVRVTDVRKKFRRL